MRYLLEYYYYTCGDARSVFLQSTRSYHMPLLLPFFFAINTPYTSMAIVIVVGWLLCQSNFSYLPVTNFSQLKCDFRRVHKSFSTDFDIGLSFSVLLRDGSLFLLLKLASISVARVICSGSGVCTRNQWKCFLFHCLVISTQSNTRNTNSFEAIYMYLDALLVVVIAAIIRCIVHLVLYLECIYCCFLTGAAYKLILELIRFQTFGRFDGIEYQLGSRAKVVQFFFVREMIKRAYIYAYTNASQSSFNRTFFQLDLFTAFIFLVYRYCIAVIY